MFGSPFSRNNGQGLSTPSHFKDSARNAIYQQLPPSVITSTASSIRSAPVQYKHPLLGQLLLSQPQLGHRSLTLSIFSSGKRSVRSAPSIYSSSTATIPEDLEPISTTVEQLVNDIVLHEKYFYDKKNLKSVTGHANDDLDDAELYKISLGSDLQYQNSPESLIDWNLNITRCKLIMVQLPMITSTPHFQYSQNLLPQLVGDLAQLCHIVLIQPHITDKELIYTLFSSNLYQEHNLDYAFKKSVAEISVKQSRLLQINDTSKRNNIITSIDTQTFLKFKFKEIAIRNYLINLAAAATTAHEYKLKTGMLKKQLKESSDLLEKVKLSKNDKKQLWEQVRLDVFKRAGLEE